MRNEITEEFYRLRKNMVYVSLYYLDLHRKFLESTKDEIERRGENTASKKELLDALDKACALLVKYSSELERPGKRNA